jgi:hypothetical protein
VHREGIKLLVRGNAGRINHGTTRVRRRTKFEVDLRYLVKEMFDIEELSSVMP